MGRRSSAWANSWPNSKEELGPATAMFLMYFGIPRSRGGIALMSKSLPSSTESSLDHSELLPLEVPLPHVKFANSCSASPFASPSRLDLGHRVRHQEWCSSERGRQMSAYAYKVLCLVTKVLIILSRSTMKARRIGGAGRSRDSLKGNASCDRGNRQVHC